MLIYQFTPPIMVGFTIFIHGWPDQCRPRGAFVTLRRRRPDRCGDSAGCITRPGVVVPWVLFVALGKHTKITRGYMGFKRCFMVT